MRRNARCPRIPRPPRPEVLAPRRGNSIVLVMGILVLLVIIATAFITRTHAGRVTSSVMVRTMLRDDNARSMAEMLAQEISMALFTRPVNDDPVNGDPAVLSGFAASSNYPRLSPLRNPIRYGADQDNDGADGIPFSGDDDGNPDYPYNFAPYTVVPFTNYPDPIAADPTTHNWPRNPGGTVGQDILLLLGVGEGNPIGNPGFGDARWLADHEPLRWAIDPGLDGIFGTDDDVQAFSHWRHMTNIAHPNNGFRICKDISDITNVNGFGGIVEDLSIPVEQWLAILPSNLDPVTGDSIFPGNYLTGDFIQQWFNWFSPAYQTMYWNNTGGDPLNVPANFYNLSDLNANDISLEEGERPQDEFIGGTPRWNVNRVLVDTDGDGFTDSFWYLAPTMTERGIRQIVAVRIIDNSAMLNANTATRFIRNDTGPSLDEKKTAGQTPADLALVGQLLNFENAFIPNPPPNWNVGFYDNPANWFIGSDYTARYGDPPVQLAVPPLDLWGRHVTEVGLFATFGTLAPNQAQRLDYWRWSGLAPLNPGVGSPYTPLTLADELELRMYHGQNYPWIHSRYEHTTQPNYTTINAFLRAGIGRKESSEYLDQLSNVELVFDSRRKLTLYSGARNDEMPPWLWWRWGVPVDVQAQGLVAEDNFLAQARRKLDLREEANPPLFDGERNFAYRLPRTLLLALLDGDENSGTSYFGEYSTADQASLDHARLAAAGLAANIREWRDSDSDLDLDDAVPLPGINTLAEDPQKRVLGMERQPFLVEAFIGHVYKGHLVEPGYLNTDSHIVHEDLPNETIVVVQIANPFDTVLELSGFRLRVFDDGTGTRELDLGALAVNLIDPGKARTFYAIVDDLDGDAFHDPWVAELNLGAGATFANAENVTASSTISTDRTDYDTGNEDRAIELIRLIPAIGGGSAAVVLDRIDILSENDTDFGDAVNGLAGPNPPVFEPPPPPADPPMDLYPGLDIGTDTHWIEWVHVTRAWHDDFAVANNQIDSEERNPRYVFAEREIDSIEDSYELVGNTINGFDGESDFNEFDKQCDSCGERRFSMQMLQKNADFEQVGELLNVWMFGHELVFIETAPGIFEYQETTQTFAEFMIDDDLTTNINDDPLVNRLRIEPTSAGATLGQVVGKPLTLVNDLMYLLDFQHAVPALPAGARVLDAFVCDGPGVNSGGTGEFLNANGYRGKITPGLININTAPPEVMRSAPHMARLIHEDNPPVDNPVVRVPEAIVRYRERFGDPTVPSTDFTPAYGDRGDDTFIEDLRGERGIASIGEIMLLNRLADGIPLGEPDPDLYKRSFRADFAGRDPFGFEFAGQPIESTKISTDVNDLPGNNPDIVAQDAEELNLLFAGMSNMLTTRSDVFTVYFRVRSFIQNPTTRVWDATNPEFIVDDSRYVMLVDRSEVNHPNDKPKILYLEKLPK